MKKIYLSLMILATIVVAFGFTACGGDDEVDAISLVGEWEYVSVEIIPSGSNLHDTSTTGSKLYFNADGTFSADNIWGRWNLDGNTLNLILNYDNEPHAIEVVKLTSKELVLKLDAPVPDISTNFYTYSTYTFIYYYKKIS